jgi:hypothetical protein
MRLFERIGHTMRGVHVILEATSYTLIPAAVLVAGGAIAAVRRPGLLALL